MSGHTRGDDTIEDLQRRIAAAKKRSARNPHGVGEVVTVGVKVAESLLAAYRAQHVKRAESWPGNQWCPVCKTYHEDVGEKTDAGLLTRPCPRLSADDPRNRP